MRQIINSLDFITTYLHLPITDPTWIFFLVLCIILFAPMLLNKLHIPHLIGMILAGVLVGEHGLNLLARDASFELFGKVGIYFIMFLAGIEMDMQSLRENRNRGFTFGAITSLLPFAFGFITGYYILEYSLAASLILACILASHTLVSYPIVGRYGISKNPAVTVSVVATMVALLFALMSLAGIAGVLRGGNTIWFWIWFGCKLLLYIAFLFLIVPKIVRFFFRKFTEPILQFTFTLAIVFLAAATAEMCGVEGILGAFLSGLILNRFVPKSSPLMNRLEFVGNALFVPYFLIGVGMLINVKPMFSERTAAIVVLIMVIAATLSKAIAAMIGRNLFNFSRTQGIMMFGLTEAHAAGALAIVMVGIRLETSPGVPLMNNAVLDGIVMMILFSCIISSFATEYAAKRLRVEEKWNNRHLRQDSTPRDDEKILIPINDLSSIDKLMSTAIMMRNRSLNRGLICLNIINDSDMSKEAQAHSKECLDTATKIAAAADVPLQTQTRLGVNFVTASIHALRENDASEMLIGLHRKRYNNDSFLGAFAQGLIRDMSRQLIIVNLKIPANTIRKIVVVVPENAQFEKGFHRWINRIARMADDLGCRIVFYAPTDTNNMIKEYMQERHKSARSEYETLDTWIDFQNIEVSDDQLMVVVTARKGGISYQSKFIKLPLLLQKDFTHCSLMIIYPDQDEEIEEGLFK